MGSDSLILIEDVYKKYSKDLQRSLWYCLKDISQDVFVRTPGEDREQLRPSEFWALRGVSFDLRRGDCLALIGPNGCGKSTLLRILSGLIKPTAGRVVVNGRLSAVIDVNAGLSPVLSGRENVFIAAALLGMEKRRIKRVFEEIVEFSELDDFIDMPIQSYSTGMRARLGFAVAAHLMQPDVLLVDEVLAVGDKAFQMKCYRHLRQQIERGAAVIIVSHNIYALYRVADRSIVLRDGKVLVEGDLNTGINHYQAVLLDRKTQTGTRRHAAVRIETARLMNKHFDSCDEFETGDDLLLDISIAKIQETKGLRLRVVILGAATGPLGGFSSAHSGLPIDIAGSRATFRVSLRDLPLLQGSYLLRVFLHGEDINDIHDWGTDLPFKISGPPLAPLTFGLEGTLALKHDWEIVDN